MEVMRNRHCGFQLWSILCLAYLLRFAIAEVLSGSDVGTQQNPPVQGNEQADLPVCADIHPVSDSSNVVVLWERRPAAECSVIVEHETSNASDVFSGIRGLKLTDVVSNKRYSITVVCLKEDGNRETGTLNFQTGVDEYSSSDCTTADWLKYEGANNLTVCIYPPNEKGQFIISYNATTAIEKCYLKEFLQSSSTPIRVMIHVLPFTVTVLRNNGSINSSFSVECFYPRYKMNFIAGPVVSHGDTALCATKFLVGEDESDDPTISPAKQSYLLIHAGLFTFCISLVILGVIFLAIFLKKKIGLYRRRQGQRLLVNEDDAAFREYREMES